MYVSPQTKPDTTTLQQIYNSFPNSIIIGDLNSKHTDFNCRTTNRNGTILRQFIEHNNLVTLNNNQATHMQNNGNQDILDLVIAPSRQSRHLTNFQVLNDIGSDHYPIYIQICPNLSPKTNARPHLPDYSHADWNQFNQLIEKQIPLVKTVTLCEADIEEYIKVLIKTLQAQNWNNLCNSIEISYPNPTLFWRKIKIITNTQPTNNYPDIIYNNTSATSDPDKAKLFAQYFTNTFVTPNIASFDQPHYLRTTQTVKSNPTLFSPHFPITLKSDNHPHSYYTRPITITEIKLILKKIKNKAPGPDCISNQVLKNLSDTNLKHLVSVFNLSLLSGYYPNIWKSALIRVIPKKDKDLTIPSNYRPISLLNTLGKLMEKTITNRINCYLETNNLISENQNSGWALHGYYFRRPHSESGFLRVLRLLDIGLKDPRFPGPERTNDVLIAWSCCADLANGPPVIVDGLQPHLSKSPHSSSRLSLAPP
ncbi:uncharacterized protein LOC143232599 [Tachypleus tridentatus]|uniref:uncharacterized protein LOC143232599 n=1 Tax=Tachypleus tridentatus TaxID=6853 RepID=UPI003FD08F39